MASDSEMNGVNNMENGENVSSANQGPIPRLMITKMRMENFKSYYGVQEVGPFHKCFSSVVGPNGSGKSNVIDAMLFVFGKRAKQIRQAKISDLIHKSENHNNLPNCRVSVFFQDIIDLPNGEYEVVPNTELVVTREARKDNSSQYYVNNKPIKWDPLGKLLLERGIDLNHNRFLILQGEVEQIAMMKPKGVTEHDEGLLEYFEDIIGSDRFKEAIEEAGKEVEQLTETWNEKLNRVKAVEKEKDGLESGKKEAEEYLMQENELSTKRNVLYQCYHHSCAEKKQKASEQLKEKEEEREKLKKDLAESVGDVKAMEKEYAKETSEYNTIQKAVDDAKAEFTACERKDIQHQEDLKHAKAKGKKLEKSLTKDKSDIASLKSNIDALESETGKYDGEMEMLKSKKAKEETVLDGIYSELKGATAELQADLAVKQKQLEPLSSALNEAQSAVDLTKSELELITSNARGLIAQKAEVEANMIKAKETATTRKQEIETLKKEQKKYQNALQKAESEMEKIAQEEEPLSQKVRSARAKFEEANSSNQQNQSRSRVLDELMKAKRNKVLRGIHGRLGDLGTINDEYDVAISTACGALNNIVVDTVRQAQECVNFIRDHNIGRATFIILEKVDYLRQKMGAGGNYPENVQRLFDLVNTEEKFKPAFYFALRNTLVAKDLDQASRIAFQNGRAQHRVVTLEGALIDTSGTMSGGGNRVARGGMSSKMNEALSVEELKELEVQMQRDIRTLEKQREMKAALETEISSLKKELAQIEVSLKRCDMDITAMEQQHQEMGKQLAELNKREGASKEEKAKESALQSQLEKEMKTLAKARAAADAVEELVKAVEKQIMDVGGVRLKAQKAKVEGLAEQIATQQANKAKSHVDLKTSKRNLDKLEKRIVQTEKEIEENKEHMETIQAEFKVIEEGAIQVMKNFEAAKALMTEKEKSLKIMKERHEKVKIEVEKFREIDVDLEHQVQELKKQLKENQDKERAWSKKINSLKLHKIGNEDDDSEDEEDAKEEDAKVEKEEEMDIDGTEEVTEGQAKASKKKTKFELRTLSSDEIEEIDCDALEYEMRSLEDKLAQLKPNMTAIKEYYKKEREYLERVAELDKITEKRDEMRSKYEDLRKQRLDTFMAGFTTITTKLKEMYQMITLGGDAELELVDRLNPFSEGIQFSVRPPKKSWKNISNLSGGEKTLSSLALVFALHHYKPTPLYVMDEIDAALDFKNVSIVANYIKERTKNAQFIIISLRNNMFELADRLIGIYKTDNCTKSVTINPAKIVEESNSAARAPLVNSAGNVSNSQPQTVTTMG